jgi:cytidylate kinase
MQTLANVVRTAASEGNAIIIGRGGAAFTHGMRNAIHIKLYAPLEWRLKSMMDRYHATRSFMLREINATDLKRHKLMESAVKGIEPGTDLYDLHINCSTVQPREMVELIIAFMQTRFHHTEKRSLV